LRAYSGAQGCRWRTKEHRGGSRHCASSWRGSRFAEDDAPLYRVCAIRQAGSTCPAQIRITAISAASSAKRLARRQEEAQCARARLGCSFVRQRTALRPRIRRANGSPENHTISNIDAPHDGRRASRGQAGCLGCMAFRLG